MRIRRSDGASLLVRDFGSGFWTDLEAFVDRNDFDEVSDLMKGLRAARLADQTLNTRATTTEDRRNVMGIRSG